MFEISPVSPDNHLSELNSGTAEPLATNNQVVPPASETETICRSATLDDIAGILGPEWTGGVDPVDFIRHQRD